MLKSHRGSNLNNVQTDVRAVNFSHLLCEINEHPPDKHSPAFSQLVVKKIRAHLIHLASLVLGIVGRVQFSRACFV